MSIVLAGNRWVGRWWAVVREARSPSCEQLNTYEVLVEDMVICVAICWGGSLNAPSLAELFVGVRKGGYVKKGEATTVF